MKIQKIIVSFNSIFISIYSRKLIQVLAYYKEDENTSLKNWELHINLIKEDREISTYNYKDKLENFSDKNKEYIKNLYDKFNLYSVFWKKEMMEFTKLKTLRAFEIIKETRIYELETRKNLCFEFLLYLVSDLNINRAGIGWKNRF